MVVHSLAVGVALLASGGCDGPASRVPPPAGDSGEPALRLVALEPPTVRGSGFRPGERVTLLVAAGPGTSASRRVTAGAGGGFTVRLPLALGRCDALVVQAVGQAGSRATVDVTQPDCASP